MDIASFSGQPQIPQTFGLFHVCLMFFWYMSICQGLNYNHKSVLESYHCHALMHALDFLTMALFHPYTFSNSSPPSSLRISSFEFPLPPTSHTFPVPTLSLYTTSSYHFPLTLPLLTFSSLLPPSPSSLPASPLSFLPLSPSLSPSFPFLLSLPLPLPAYTHTNTHFLAR